MRSARATCRQRAGRTRREDLSEVSLSTISKGRMNDARALRFEQSRPRTSSMDALPPCICRVTTQRSSRIRTVSPGASEEATLWLVQGSFRDVSRPNRLRAGSDD